MTPHVRPFAGLRTIRMAGALGAALLSTACGGSIEFQDTTPIRIASAAPVLEVEPPEPAPVAEKQIAERDNRVAIDTTVQFDYDSARLSSDAESTLRDIARTLQDSPHVRKVRVEGHASAEGSEAHNRRLSARRAGSVVSFLVSQGVQRSRLEQKAFGESRPIADNDTDYGRQQNRRVAFDVVDQEVTLRRIEVDPATGEETVLETLAQN